MPSPRPILLWATLALLIFAPPALLLFGNWNSLSKRDRENLNAFNAPPPPTPPSAAAPFTPPGDTPGVLRTFGPGTTLRALAVSPDARNLFAVGGDSNVRKWDLDGSSSSSHSVGYGNFKAIACAPDGQRIIAGPHGAPLLWNLATGQMRPMQSSFGEQIQCIAIAPNGRTALTGSTSGTLRVWNLDAHAEIGLVGMYQNGSTILAVAYSADGKNVHAASDRGGLRVYDLRTGQHLMGRNHNESWSKGAFSPDGRLLLTGSRDGAAALYDVQDHGNRRLRFQAHRAPITAVAFSPDASRIATAAGAEIALWETATAKQISTFSVPRQQNIVGGDIAILPTNRHLLFSGNGISLILMPPASSPPLP